MRAEADGPQSRQADFRLTVERSIIRFARYMFNRTHYSPECRLTGVESNSLEYDTVRRVGAPLDPIASKTGRRAPDTFADKAIRPL
jgi:hypothetical protein